MIGTFATGVFKKQRFILLGNVIFFVIIRTSTWLTSYPFLIKRNIKELFMSKTCEKRYENIALKDNQSLSVLQSEIHQIIYVPEEAKIVIQLQADNSSNNNQTCHHP